MISRVLNRVYLKFVRPTDPGLFITRYAGKSTVCCLAAMGVALLLSLEGDMLLWWLIGSLCTLIFRTGSTLTRRKMYSLILLGTVSVTVPVAASVAGHPFLSLTFVFILSFVCFLVASMGVSASTLGIGCLVVSMISVFEPAGTGPALIRSLCLLGGGSIAFWVNFYLWPFDPNKALLSSARLAVEDMGTFFDGLSARIRNPRVTEASLEYMSGEAMASIRRYRIFMESFNIDPLKGSAFSGGAGMYYFGLIRLYESLVGLSQHIGFCDDRPEFYRLKKGFDSAASGIIGAFDAFAEMKSATYKRPDFDPVFADIEEIQNTLVEMKGYRRGEESQEQFMEAWGAVYELKSVARELRDMMALADQRFSLKADAHGI